MIKRLSHIALFSLFCVSAYSQNILLNNWSIHENTDTNFFLTITAIDQFRHSNIGIGRWANGSLQNINKQVVAADLRNRELLRISYSKPDFELGFTTSQLSQHHKIIGGVEFNGLMSGHYPANDTLNVQSLTSLHRSALTHSLEFTKKGAKTIFQLAINGSQINALRHVNTRGQFIRNEFIYSGAYQTLDATYNGQLNYLGSPEEVLGSNLNWGDSVRITTILQLPLLPSLNFHLIHRPTEFTEFHLRMEGLSFQSQLPVRFATDSITYKLSPGEIPNYETFTEELPLVLNNDDNYRRFDSKVVNDTAILYRAIPLRVMGAYKVQIEPLTSVAFSFSYTKYDPYSLVLVNTLIERTYNDELRVQGGLSASVIGASVQPNLSLGIKAKLANKLTFFGHTNSLLSFPYINSTLVPSWSNRIQLNATLQYQLL